jgi:organic hydroperoxide reductase OsmC/OhrA
MHQYTARISWLRGAGSAENRYSRLHEWTFDGGIRVPASASPQIVRAPFSVAEAVDPEEALVAAAASCHMLSFLHAAAAGGYRVESYVDDAVGMMTQNERGKLWISRITLRPAITFGGDKVPSEPELEHLHHKAHEECFIANSLRSEVVVEQRAPATSG